MGIARTNRTALRYLQQAAYGVIPALPMRTLAFSSESLQHNTSSTQSELITSSRDIRDIIRTEVSGAGDFRGELHYGAYDDILEAALGATWVADVLENGTQQKIVTVEKEFQGDAPIFMSFRDNGVNTFGLQVQRGRPIGISGSFLGARGVPSDTSVGTGAPIPAPTTRVQNPIDHIEVFSEGGVGVVPLGFEFSINNNMENAGVATSLDPIDIGYGDFSVTGNLEIHLRDRTQLDKYVDFLETAFILQTRDLAGNMYRFSIFSAHFTEGSPQTGGKNQWVPLNLGFMAKLNADEGCTMRIEREAAGSS